MPKSMRQPNIDDTKLYFQEYCEDQIKKTIKEMNKLTKRMKKLEKARLNYYKAFQEELTLGDNYEKTLL